MCRSESFGMFAWTIFSKKQWKHKSFLCMRLMFWWSVCDVSAIEIVQYCTLPSYSISYLLNERLHHTQQTTIARFLLNNKQIPTNTDSLKCRRGDKTSTLFLMQPFSPAGMIQMILRRDTYMSIYVYAVCAFCSMVCYPGLYSCLLCLHVAAFLVGDFWDVNCILKKAYGNAVVMETEWGKMKLCYKVW